jgi:ABC-type uncharacterized transport system involved in gliding motility auxiliary subunit
MEGLKMSIKRKTKYGLNTIVAIVLFIGILGIINFLSDRHHLRTDLTYSGIFSLADQTDKILKGLDEEVKVYAFYQIPDRRLEDLLNEYKLKSEKFQYDFVDPDKEPELAKAYDVQNYGTVIVKSGDNLETLSDVTEEKLTNALLKVSREERKKIYFLAGHDERDVENIEREGYNAAKIALEEENYEIGTVTIAREGEEVPQDCAALVIASPKVALLEHEIAKIESYLKSGGSALLMLDPAPGIGLEEFAAGWGVNVGNDVVVDVSGVGRLFGAGPTIPLVTDYLSHSITSDFKVMTFFPLTRSITPAGDSDGKRKVEMLLQTTTRSWAEKNFTEEKFKLDKDVDVKGPVPIAVAVTNEFEPVSGSLEEPESTDKERNIARMVVFGDSDFACNSYFSVSGNSDLFLNVVNWLAEEEDLISIRPKAREDRRVTMTAAQSRAVFYLTVFAMPLMVLVAGVVIKLRRK